MTNTAREPMYLGLLGRIAFDADKRAEGYSKDEIDTLWEARWKPAAPDNVIQFRPRR
jgi:hypothetical protein